MNYAKPLALIVMSVVALLTASGTASATSLTQEPTYTGTLHAESEGTIVLLGPAKVECKSTLEGVIEQGGGSSPAGGKLGKLTMEECGSSNHVKILAPGSLEIHTQEAAVNGNGTVTSTGTEIEVKYTSALITCIYATSETDIGTFTGSKNTGGTATFDLKTLALPRTGGSIFCGSIATWTGSYTIDTPDYLDVD